MTEIPFSPDQAQESTITPDVTVEYEGTSQEHEPAAPRNVALVTWEHVAKNIPIAAEAVVNAHPEIVGIELVGLSSADKAQAEHDFNLLLAPAADSLAHHQAMERIQSTFGDDFARLIGIIIARSSHLRRVAFVDANEDNRGAWEKIEAKDEAEETLEAHLFDNTPTVTLCSDLESYVHAVVASFDAREEVIAEQVDELDRSTPSTNDGDQNIVLLLGAFHPALAGRLARDERQISIVEAAPPRDSYFVTAVKQARQHPGQSLDQQLVRRAVLEEFCNSTGAYLESESPDHPASQPGFQEGVLSSLNDAQVAYLLGSIDQLKARYAREGGVDYRIRSDIGTMLQEYAAYTIHSTPEPPVGS